MDLDDEELEATRKLHGLNKQEKAEKIIVEQKKEIERLNTLVDTMKRNVKENYISKLELERKIRHIILALNELAEDLSQEEELKHIPRID